MTRIAIQENLVPGANRRERFANARAYGFGAVETRGALVPGDEREYLAFAEEFDLPITTICGGIEGCLLDPDPRERETALASILTLLRAGHALGGAHLIAVPIFGQPRLPDLTPFQSAVELEMALLAPLLQRIVSVVETEGLTARLLLEPLNRYETHLLNRVEQAVALADQIGSPAISVMGDLFHMQIEERDTPAALRRFAGRIDHIHLADSNRKLPGQGQMDYAALFDALREIGYGGTLALECGILGQPEEQLPVAAAFLNKLAAGALVRA